MAHDNTVFRNTSWGRTRSPKNIINSDHTTPQGVTLTAGDVDSAAYNTENQRYLHVNHTMVAGDGNGVADIQLQVYMHASGLWANLGSVFSSTTTTKYECVEIKGVDKVRFVATGLTGTETCTIFAACSTF